MNEFALFLYTNVFVILSEDIYSNCISLIIDASLPEKTSFNTDLWYYLLWGNIFSKYYGFCFNSDISAIKMH